MDTSTLSSPWPHGILDRTNRRLQAAVIFIHRIGEGVHVRKPEAPITRLPGLQA